MLSVYPRVQLGQQASTGPRSFERGDFANRNPPNRTLRLLQRGRALSSAEMRPSCWPRQPSRSQLQRGRALSSAEMAGQPSLARPPIMLQRGRALSSAEMCLACPTRSLPTFASTGPRSFERGDLQGHRADDGVPDASTGPRSFERGDMAARIRGKRMRGRFNGAALFRARR